MGPDVALSEFNNGGSGFEVRGFPPAGEAIRQCRGGENLGVREKSPRLAPERVGVLRKGMNLSEVEVGDGNHGKGEGEEGEGEGEEGERIGEGEEEFERLDSEEHGEGGAEYVERGDIMFSVTS